MKKQILMLSGGRSFRDRQQLVEFYKNYDIEKVKGKSWKHWLEWTLEDTHEFIFPDFPLRSNADYEIHKIILEKYLTKLNNESLTIVAHSLGTIFIMKYLLENGFVKKIKELHLVASWVANEFESENYVENTGSFTFDYENVGEIVKYCETVHVWHSSDDEMCSIKNSEYLMDKIPNAIFHRFDNKGHFLQSTFVELFDVLR